MTPSARKIALYYRVAKRGFRHWAIRFIARRMGYICIPETYIGWLKKSDSTIAEDLIAFRDYGKKED